MELELKRIAAKVCKNTCFAHYDCGKDKLRNPIGALGTNNTCPLLKYEIKHKEDKRSFVERILDQVTVAELNVLCEHCDFRDKSKDTAHTFSRESCFESHCLDCPVHLCLDNIIECEAEAAMS